MANDIITFKDGLTPEIIKEKYPWLLKADIEEAVIGQDVNYHEAKDFVAS